MNFNEIKIQTDMAIRELIDRSDFEKGDFFIVGCSTSEVMGETIGRGSSIDVAKAIYEGIKPVLDEHKLNLAVQCCEHLNRAIVVEKESLSQKDDIVNVVPQLKAGGAFAVVAYENANNPVVVERISASGGMDIGDTLIGMHLKPVAVPVRLEVKSIGKAHLVCARTRPKYIGGERAIYDRSISGGDVER